MSADSGNVSKITNNGKHHGSDIDYCTTTSFSGGVVGSWDVLDVHRDVILATCSAPNCPPVLYCAKLPAAGEESTIVWHSLDDLSACSSKEALKMIWSVPGFRRSPKPGDVKELGIFKIN